MLRNTKSRGVESPALQKKVFVLAGQENDNIPASALQGFSSCVPCANCPHFLLYGLTVAKFATSVATPAYGWNLAA